MALLFHSLDDPALLRLLNEGAVGIIPTDTIYGLVCSARHEKSVRRLYELKQREQKPGTLIAANVKQMIELGIPKRYLKPAEHFWPGSISVVVPCDDELSYLHLGKRSLAVRVPADKRLEGLLQHVGPLLTTSANHPGEPTATTTAEARHYFGEMVDFYVDGGEINDRPPSTIIRVIDDEIEVLRDGAVKIDANGKVLPDK